jgi:ketosteroid isomerase-like protein
MPATTQGLQRLLDAFNAHDLDAVMGCFADDCVLEMPRGPERWGRRAVGKAAVRAALAARFAGLPDVRYDDAAHIACGDVGITKWTIRGTTPGGQVVEANGCDVYTFRDGLVTVKDSYWKIVEPG